MIAATSIQHDSQDKYSLYWVQQRREDDIIRATTQLPGEYVSLNLVIFLFEYIYFSIEQWAGVTSVIGSTNHSPAARRVAVSLTFLAYVLVPQLGGNRAWPEERYMLVISVFARMMFDIISQCTCNRDFTVPLLFC